MTLKTLVNWPLLIGFGIGLIVGIAIHARVGDAIFGTRVRDNSREVAVFYENAYNRLNQEHNNLISIHNKLVADYNSLRIEYRANIDAYNKLATNYNNLVAEYKKLASLRSVVETIGALALQGIIQSYLPAPLLPLR